MRQAPGGTVRVHRVPGGGLACNEADGSVHAFSITIDDPRYYHDTDRLTF